MNRHFRTTTTTPSNGDIIQIPTEVSGGMLPSVGYFKSILCPYFQDDSCERPYCQFRHEHLPVKQPKTLAPKIEEPGSSKTLPLNEKSSALEEIVSEAVKRVLKENGQLLENLDASKIMELVGHHKLVEKVVENLVPAQAPKKPESNNSKNKAHKTYCIPAGVPAYTPTPISVLKKTKQEPSKPNVSYTPTNISGGSSVPSAVTTKSSTLEYEPTTSSVKKFSSSDSYEPHAKSQVPITYSPSKPHASYIPSNAPGKSSKKSDADSSEGYFPSSLSEYNPESLTKSQPKQSVAYEPSKALYKHEETYTPSTSEKVAEVEYKPSSKKADQETSDAYTPSSTLDCGVDYKPTVKELSSCEPSYSPYSSASAASSTVDYAPSSIKLHQALTTEPAYSPMSTNNNRTHVNYAPSSIKLNQALTTEPTYSPVSTNQNRPQVEYIPSSAGPPLSPEKYLALLEGLDDTMETEPSAAKQQKVADDETKKKERQREKEREKEKERQRRKEKEREREKRKSSSSKGSDSKSKHSSSSSSSSSKRHKSSSESKSDSKTSKSRPSESKEASRNDDDDESGSDVNDECYRIFKEYKPAVGESQPEDQKKRKTEEPPPVSEAIIPVKKQRIAHVASEAPSRPVPIAKPPERLSPGMAMIERMKKAQEARAAAAKAAPSSPFGSSSGTEKKRIAHVPNVMGLLTTRPKAPTGLSQTTTAAGTSSNPFRPQQKPAIGSVNGTNRPAVTNNTNKAPAPATRVPRPTIAVETKCRVPASIRQRYLNVLCDETLKIYDQEEDAYQRAVEEEKQAYAKCSSKVVYINVITNLVQKIRREAEASGNKASASGSQVERKVQSHSAMLAGKGGATVSWSIEKPRAGKVDSNLLKGVALYRLLERYVITLEQQDTFGYPRPDPNERGKAVINTANKCRQKPVGLNLAPDQRCCDRCGTVYRVNSKGLAAKDDDTCTYHWGRKFTRRGEGRYTCCQGDSTSEGCSVAKFHITESGNMDHQRSGYVRTMVKSPPPDGNYGVYALDCEMCYTTEGPELTRVTVISSDNQTVYETLVKPDNPILDYNTRFSGISEEDMANVKTTIRDVQAVLLSKFSNKTILIGHSFDSDLRALKIIHDTVIDTSIVFPHPKGLPFRRALRTLCGEYLQKIIQNDVGGHDSAEDAIACMELMLWKVKQDLKLMKS